MVGSTAAVLPKRPLDVSPRLQDAMPSPRPNPHRTDPSPSPSPKHAGLQVVPQVGVALDPLRVLDGRRRVDGAEDDPGHEGEEEGERRLAWVRVS